MLPPLLGVDKPNVRFVFHHDISDSVDSYYQEIGPSGRDGEQAKSLLFYCEKDLNIRRFFASSGKVDVEHVEQVAATIQAQNEPINLKYLKEKTELSQAKLTTVISRLEEVGVVETLPTGEVVSWEESTEIGDATKGD